AQGTNNTLVLNFLTILAKKRV
ncbi:pathogenicity domain protein, partial [Campylobacter jejuni]|nr:pathogenicity domain protein [Campylobacter jejuni]